MPRPHHIPGVLIALGASAALAAAGDWPTLARGPQRVAVADEAPASLGQPTWVFSQAPGGPFEPVGQSGVVTGAGLVFAVGMIGEQPSVVAIDQATGAFVWAAETPEPAFESWSTPTFDARTGALYIAAGRRVVALDAASGAQLWESDLLAGDVVNATPVVTSDLGSANRLFITDSSGFGGGGRLYCINVDPRHMTLNPFDRGEIVWEFELGQTAGSTPAYYGGVVFVATAGDSAGRPPGLLFALPAGASASPNPLWATPNPAPEGFFGGVSITTVGGEPVLYAASYAFYGSLMSGNLVKVRAVTGEVVWSAPANRTASIPTPLGDGRILLSCGLQGFGTVPSVQMFRDHGAVGQLLWDTALWTWKDLNGNQALDPGEFTPMGGWTHQPAVGRAGARSVAIFGTLPGGGFDPYGRLRVVDLKYAPGNPNFVLAEAAAGGSSPAVVGGSVYSIGASGVAGFVARQCYADCDNSGKLDLFDILCFQTKLGGGDPEADCDLSGALDFFDLLCFLGEFGEGC